MSKVSAPLLSFEAHGTLGDSITFKRSKGKNIAGGRPLPPLAVTLPKQYQRWLYQDYVYLWSQQSAATKAIYKARATANKTTPVAEWLRYCLSEFPDILGWWRLDEKTGSVAFDSSKHHNNGAILTPVFSTGVIYLARYFNGTTDYIDLGNPVALQMVNNFTVEMFIDADAVQGALHDPISHGHTATAGWVWQASGAAALNALFGNGTTISGVPFGVIRGTGRRHLVAVKSSTFGVRTFVDGFLFASNAALTAPVVLTGSNMFIGKDSNPGRNCKGMIDNVIVFNRCLDATEILRHSLRSFPSV